MFSLSAFSTQQVKQPSFRTDKSAPVKTTVIAASSGSIKLDSKAVRTALEATNRKGVGTKTLSMWLNSLQHGERIFLVLRGLNAMKQPGVLYHVYFDLPADRNLLKDDASYVGTISFYDSVNVKTSDLDETPFTSYDVTSVLKRLESRRLLSAPPTITIVPFGTPNPQAHASITRIELVVQ